MAKIIDHPLISIKLSELRDEKTNHTNFRKTLNEITALMVYEILRDYKTKSKKITTPNKIVMDGHVFDKEIVILPILRAGLGMVQGIEMLIPQAKIGHIGMYRDEKTFKSVPYFFKMPDVPKDSEILLVDPMLATGVSSCDALLQTMKKGFSNIKLVCLVGAPEGVKKIEKQFPNINIYLAALDKELNNDKYIIPGLGDAGDRLFGTK